MKISIYSCRSAAARRDFFQFPRKARRNFNSCQVHVGFFSTSNCNSEWEEEEASRGICKSISVAAVRRHSRFIPERMNRTPPIRWRWIERARVSTITIYVLTTSRKKERERENICDRYGSWNFIDWSALKKMSIENTTRSPVRISISQVHTFV